MADVVLAIQRLTVELWKLRGQLDDEVGEINRKIESDDVDVLIECREMIPQAEWDEFRRWRQMRLIHARRRQHTEESRGSE